MQSMPNHAKLLPLLHFGTSSKGGPSHPCSNSKSRMSYLGSQMTLFGLLRVTFKNCAPCNTWEPNK
ncbi:hypothetical protein CsatA_004405 [Cannabis sativa]